MRNIRAEVHKKRRKSNQGPAFWMYSQSRTSFRRTLARSISGDKLTWASPVMPGRTESRIWYPGMASDKIRTNSGRSGPGANERHLAAKHIVDFRQFVEVQRPQDASQESHSRILDLRPDGPADGLGVDSHGANFKDHEAPAILADAHLSIKSGAPGCRTDQQEEDGDYDGDREKEQSRYREIHKGFPTKIGGAARRKQMVDMLFPGLAAAVSMIFGNIAAHQ